MGALGGMDILACTTDLALSLISVGCDFSRLRRQEDGMYPCWIAFPVTDDGEELG